MSRDDELKAMLEYCEAATEGPWRGTCQRAGRRTALGRHGLVRNPNDRGDHGTMMRGRDAD